MLKSIAAECHQNQYGKNRSTENGIYVCKVRIEQLERILSKHRSCKKFTRVADNIEQGNDRRFQDVNQYKNQAQGHKNHVYAESRRTVRLNVDRGIEENRNSLPVESEKKVGNGDADRNGDQHALDSKQKSPAGWRNLVREYEETG